MEPLRVNYGVELGIYNKKTNGFLRYDGSRNVKADSIHPFLKTNSINGDEVCYEEFCIYNQVTPSTNGYITFGSHVFIVNKTGCYLTVDDQGTVLGLKIPERNNMDYLRYSTWTIQSKDNPASHGPVNVTDAVILKSSLGNYLRVEDYGSLKADASVPSDRYLWHFCKARIPFVPNWARIRPFVSASHLTPSLGGSAMTEEVSANKNRPQSVQRDPRLETTGGQERVLIQELLYVLLSVEGKYIKRKADTTNNRCFYVIDKDSQLDSSLVLMVSNILPLCEFHDRIVIFIEKYSTFDSGVIFQALANAVKSIRRQYVAAINALDQEFQKGHFTLQRMWYETQKPNKIFEYLCKILNDIESTTSESLLTVLYKHLLIATDSEIHKLVYALLQHAVFPFLEMLGKWIYYGIVDDKFKEFMIIEKTQIGLDQKTENFDWHERFSLNQPMIPLFLTSVAEKILATGKYLNVIKNYDKASQCPYSRDLIENHELYLQRQDFSECIDKAFEWANRELIRIIMQEKKLIERLFSIKQYFFLEAGDLFIHFMDSAESELAKDVRLISQEKLQSLLEMSIRTSSAEKDPFKDDVYCYLAGYKFSDILPKYLDLPKKDLHKLDPMICEDTNNENRNRASKQSKGHEFLTLGYTVEWPLNLILSEVNLILYKMMFKHLFTLRYTELELYKRWAANQELKSHDNLKPITVHFLLVQRMLNFVRNVIYNFCTEVIESHWKILVDNLTNFHDDFLSSVTKDTLLNDAIFSKRLGKVLKVCIMMTYAMDMRTARQRQLGSYDFKDGADMQRKGRVIDEEEQKLFKFRMTEIRKLSLNFSQFFDQTVTELLEYMDTEHHKFDQTFTNLLQRLDFYGYYTKHQYNQDYQ